jgi:uncharacterized protein (TIGR02271 family)
MEDVRRGMMVRSTSGIHLGVVVRTDAHTFVVGKGVFFQKDHELHYGGIAEIRDNDIVYRLSQEATAGAAPQPLPPTESYRTTELPEGKELRVPLMEEQVVVEKSTRETGAVRIHKNVVSEQRQITVPVRHEEVIIERRPAGPSTPAQVTTRPFEDERYSIPIHEEAFQVIKRSVLKEEVSVRRVTREEQRVASATVRHEELEVEDTSRKAPSVGDPARKDKKEV